jgi:hypothetical protein
VTTDRSLFDLICWRYENVITSIDGRVTHLLTSVEAIVRVLESQDVVISQIVLVEF